MKAACSIPDWNKFLSNNRNKQELISFLGEFISNFVIADNPLPVGQTVYLAGTFRNPEVVKKIAGDQVIDCVDLFSIQEEADTRIMLHALHADEQFGKSSVQGRIIIKSSDSDVLVLCGYKFPTVRKDPYSPMSLIMISSKNIQLCCVSFFNK